jgi:hypothetical protein
MGPRRRLASRAGSDARTPMITGPFAPRAISHTHLICMIRHPLDLRSPGLPAKRNDDLRKEYDLSNARRAKDVPHLAKLQSEAARGKTFRDGTLTHAGSITKSSSCTPTDGARRGRVADDGECG